MDTDHKTLMTEFPAAQPSLPLLWTALVDVGPSVDLGATAEGRRYMVPILGGAFYGGPGYEALSGTVLPGGADRQLAYADGRKDLNALYEMQINDGPILTIENAVKVDEAQTPRYAASVIGVTAPEGPFDWLNKRIVLGTLQSARPARDVVVVRAWLALP